MAYRCVTLTNSETMQCIICMKMKSRRKTGGEHVIPYSLGGSFTIDRVCEDCDSSLGHTADEGLVNHFAVEQRRAQLQLRGQSGTVPDPQRRELSRPLAGLHDPHHRIRFERDTAGVPTARTISHVEFDVQETPNGLKIVPVHTYIDPSDAGRAEVLAQRALRRALRKKGIENEEIVNKVGRAFVESLQTFEEQHIFERPFQIRFGGHEPGLLKIAYELAWYWLGDTWLNDPVAAAMRELLNGDTPAQMVRGRIFDDPNCGIVAVGGDPRVLHIAYVFEFSGKILVVVRIFDLLTVGFEVANDAVRYRIPERNAIVMQNVERTYEETTFGLLVPGSIVWRH